MSHTEGKIEVRTYDGSIGTIDSIEGEFTLAQAQAIPITGRGIVAAQEERKENARRLVACWNACDGIDTEDLEHGNKYCDQPMLQRGLQNMKALDLIQERDELRKAAEVAVSKCRELAGCPMPYGIVKAVMDLGAALEKK